jgi:hypothetical protein
MKRKQAIAEATEYAKRDGLYMTVSVDFEAVGNGYAEDEAIGYLPTMSAVKCFQHDKPIGIIDPSGTFTEWPGDYVAREIAQRVAANASEAVSCGFLAADIKRIAPLSAEDCLVFTKDGAKLRGSALNVRELREVEKFLNPPAPSPVTTGEWVVSPTERNACFVGVAGADGSYSGDIAELHFQTSRPPQEQRANARLFADAKKILALLQWSTQFAEQFAREHNDGPTMASMIAQCRAMIEKHGGAV